MLIRFFSQNSDIWFMLVTLVVSLLGVLVTLATVNASPAKTTVVIVLVVIFIVSLIVVSNNYSEFTAGNQTLAHDTNANSSQSTSNSSTSDTTITATSVTPIPPATATFKDLVAIDYDGTSIDHAYHTDTFGNQYDVELGFWSDEAYVIFLTDNKYSVFSGTIAFSDNAGSNARKETKYISILADGIEIYKNSITVTTRPIDFTLDINDVEQLQIRGDTYVLIGNGEFSNH